MPHAHDGDDSNEGALNANGAAIMMLGHSSLGMTAASAHTDSGSGNVGCDATQLEDPRGCADYSDDHDPLGLGFS